MDINEKLQNHSSILCCGIQLEQDFEDDLNFNKFVAQLSIKVSQSMIPFYQNYMKQIQNQKILSCYPVLTQMEDIDICPKLSQININKASTSIKNQLKQDCSSELKISNNSEQDEQSEISEQDDFDQFEKKQSKNIESQIRKLERAKDRYNKLCQQLKWNKKRRGDKKRPKRCRSLYNYFVRETIPKLKTQNPDGNTVQLMRKASRMFNELSGEQRIFHYKRYDDYNNNISAQVQKYEIKKQQNRRLRKPKKQRRQSLMNHLKNLVHNYKSQTFNKQQQ